MSNNSLSWLDIAGMVSAGTSILAIILSAFSFWVSQKAYALSQKAEARKQFRFSLYLQNGHMKFNASTEDRSYAFAISISNLSDTNNSVARIELVITYTTPTNTELRHRLESDARVQAEFNKLTNTLSAPIKIDAHQTIQGWCYFKAKGEILRNSKINNYRIIVTDSHGKETEIQSIIVQEHNNEILE